MGSAAKDEIDAQIHFDMMQQVYLTYYEGERGPLFGVQRSLSERMAREDAALFEEDGYPARVIKVTVENGEPVARWA